MRDKNTGNLMGGEHDLLLEQAAVALEEGRTADARAVLALLAPLQAGAPLTGQPENARQGQVPPPAEALRLLALSWHMDGNAAAAVEAAGHYAALEPEGYLLQAVLARHGRLWKAMREAVQQALSTRDACGTPLDACGAGTRRRSDHDQATLLAMLAEAEDALGQPQQALEACRQRLALTPGDREALLALATLQRNYGLAETARHQAAELTRQHPDWAPAWNLYASASLESGRPAEALAAWQRTLALSPELPFASNFLYALQFQPEVTAAECTARHRGMMRSLATVPPVPAPSSLLPAPPLPLSGGRKMRIGYLSPDLRSHSVSSFLEPVLEHHDRQQVEVICYPASPRRDATTVRLQGLVQGWHPVDGLDDDQAARMIAGDRLDVLVDLAGHTNGNRLGIFARRPAPLQLSWLGYPDITGLPQMDGHLTDAWCDPPDAGGSDGPGGEDGPEGEDVPGGGERLIRLPHGFHCWRPPADCPLPVEEPPGPFTFGCFGTMGKMNPPVIAAWAAILRQAPHSRLLLKCRSMADPAQVKSVRQTFSSLGVDPSRLELVSHIASKGGHLELYRTVHLALDTFPYNGTTTLCEALWMGTPVLSLTPARGSLQDRRVARVATSLLRTVGLGEALLADSVEDYVTRAVRLASQPEQLLALRRGLRQQVAASPLRDEAGFTRTLEQALRQALRQVLEPAPDLGPVSPGHPFPLADERAMPS